ncbi:SMI1/KNR4 family protein [Streptacidiphilus anmyonensis]|uniref:SMI1/KNR4 family protein n=1 Tax=Streptacidiphilus anmyonensis TaxID=405782 RepID=UPI000694DBD1|nr:SMI1/KNR4 family protein [Streptacidiphilus anmyonensis]
MHPDVERLVALLPPGPDAGDRFDWRAVERDLGCRLPADFRDLVTVYGVGAVDGRVMLLPPTNTAHESGIPSVGQMTPSAEKTAWLDHTKSTYPLWPAPGSLLCGLRMVDGNGDLWGAVYWHTTGPDPDRWPVIVWERHHPFVEFDLNMTGLLLTWLTEAAGVDFDRRMVFGAPHSRFVHWRAERAMRERGVDPWEYLEPLYLEANEEWEERNLVGAAPAGGPGYESGPEPPAAGFEIPQLAVLGITAAGSGDLLITASVALGSGAAGQMTLTPPLGPFGPVVEVSGPEGLLAVAFGADVTAPAPGAPLLVSAAEPLVFETRVPASAVLVDATWPELLGRFRSGTSLKIVVQDPAIAALRAAPGGTSEADDVVAGWWPPR